MIESGSRRNFQINWGIPVPREASGEGGPVGGSSVEGGAEDDQSLTADPCGSRVST